jgi:hypothetical protein
MKHFLLALGFIMLTFGMLFAVILPANATQPDVEASNDHFGSFGAIMLQLLSVMTGGCDYETFRSAMLQPGGQVESASCAHQCTIHWHQNF